MADSHAPELQKPLKSRHMTMISLGEVIGAGLLVGTSAVIHAAYWSRTRAERRTGTVAARAT
jgi:L-asparagine transporter-like permease